jgi:hypothetical protein
MFSQEAVNLGRIGGWLPSFTVAGGALPMESRRVEQTLLYRKFGLFNYSGELQNHGLTSPYEQIAAIARVIEEGIGKAQALPDLSNGNEVERWMREVVSITVRRWHKSSPEPESLELIALRSAAFVAWNLYADFAELLNALSGPSAYEFAARRLRRHGFSIGLSELSDLAGQFVLVLLPQAVRSFDPRIGRGHEVEWLSTVFYRFALKQMISERVTHSDLQELSSLAASTNSPELSLQTDVEHSALQALPEALGRLSARDRLAVELYFGFHGRERTLSEVAQEIGSSEYLAKMSIVRSLGFIAGELGSRGGLDRQEFSLLRLHFNEGLEIKAVAKKLGIDQRMARELNSRVLRKLHSGLRVRTGKPLKSVPHPHVGKEDDMLIRALVNDEQIISMLSELRAYPELRPNKSGELLAKLHGDWVGVNRIRRAVIQRPQVIDSLEGSGVPLGWLAVPDSTTERADLPEDYLEWAEKLQSLSDRAGVVARTLYFQSLDEAKQDRVTLSPHSEEDLVERIFRTVGGVAQAIESELPRAVRRSGKAYFRIERLGTDCASGGWEGDPEDLKFDLGELLESEAKLMGELSGDFVSILSRVFIRGILDGTASLPGYHRVKDSNRDVVWLELLPMTTEAALASLQEDRIEEADPPQRLEDA